MYLIQYRPSLCSSKYIRYPLHAQPWGIGWNTQVANKSIDDWSTPTSHVYLWQFRAPHWSLQLIEKLKLNYQNRVLQPNFSEVKTERIGESARRNENEIPPPESNGSTTQAPDNFASYPSRPNFPYCPDPDYNTYSSRLPHMWCYWASNILTTASSC